MGRGQQTRQGSGQPLLFGPRIVGPGPPPPVPLSENPYVLRLATLMEAVPGLHDYTRAQQWQRQTNEDLAALRLGPIQTDALGRLIRYIDRDNQSQTLVIARWQAQARRQTQLSAAPLTAPPLSDPIYHQALAEILVGWLRSVS